MMIPLDGRPGVLETVCIEAALGKWGHLRQPLEDYFNSSGVSGWRVGKQDKMRIQCILAATCEKNPYTTIARLYEKNERYHIPLDAPLLVAALIALAPLVNASLDQFKFPTPEPIIYRLAVADTAGNVWTVQLDGLSQPIREIQGLGDIDSLGVQRSGKHLLLYVLSSIGGKRVCYQFKDRKRTFNPGLSRLGIPPSGRSVTIGHEYGRDPNGQGRRWDPSAINSRKPVQNK